MARPRVKIDPEQVEKLAAINCSYEETAAVLQCSVTTIQRRYLKEFLRGREIGKMTLKRQMWRKAIDKDHAQMQIWLSKNLLGYTDKIDQNLGHTINHENEINELVDWLVKIEKDKKP